MAVKRLDIDRDCSDRSDKDRADRSERGPWNRERSDRDRSHRTDGDHKDRVRNDTEHSDRDRRDKNLLVKKTGVGWLRDLSDKDRDRRDNDRTGAKRRGIGAGATHSCAFFDNKTDGNNTISKNCCDAEPYT